MLQRVLQNPCCLELGHLGQRIHKLPVGAMQHDLTKRMLNIVLCCRAVLELGYALYIVGRFCLILLGSVHRLMGIKMRGLLCHCRSCSCAGFSGHSLVGSLTLSHAYLDHGSIYCFYLHIITPLLLRLVDTSTIDVVRAKAIKDVERLDKINEKPSVAGRKGGRHPLATEGGAESKWSG